MKKFITFTLLMLPVHVFGSNGLVLFGEEHIVCHDIGATVFLPNDGNSISSRKQLFPVIVFGHGWLLSLRHYRSTFEELAKSGVAVIFPELYEGLFSWDHARLTKDFLNITKCTLAHYQDVLDKSHVTFAGHSLGAKVAALAAASAKQNGLLPVPQGILLLETALGGEEVAFARDFQKISVKTAVVVIHAQGDTTARKAESKLIYDVAPGPRKEFLVLQSDNVGHDWPMTDNLLGLWGGPVGPLHMIYLWPWLKDIANDVLPNGDVGVQIGGVGISVERPIRAP